MCWGISWHVENSTLSVISLKNNKDITTKSVDNKDKLFRQQHGVTFHAKRQCAARRQQCCGTQNVAVMYHDVFSNVAGEYEQYQQGVNKIAGNEMKVGDKTKHTHVQ